MTHPPAEARLRDALSALRGAASEALDALESHAATRHAPATLVLARALAESRKALDTDTRKEAV